MPAKGFADAVAQDSSADDTLLMSATQKPIAMKSVQEPMTEPAWKEKRSWFLVAERDRVIAPETPAIHGSSRRRPDACGGRGPHSTCLRTGPGRRYHHPGSRCYLA
jgi:hypothetical protein